MAAPDVFVFDACAIVALLDCEEGAAAVEDLLLQPNYRCRVHVLNLCEVFYHLHRSAGPARAAQLEAMVREFGFELEDSLPAALWKTAGELKATWRRVALADCFAVALTLQVNGTFVTADHHEIDRLAEAGVCRVRFIR